MTHPPDTTGLCLVVCAVDSPGGGGGAQGFRAWVAERLLSAGALDLCRRADKVREIQDMQLYPYIQGWQHCNSEGRQHKYSNNTVV